MKRIISMTAFLGAMGIVSLTGCLKDKDYDNGVYGVNPSEQHAVSFARSTNTSYSPIPLGILAQVDPVTIALPVISLEASTVQSQDVHVNVVTDDTLYHQDASIDLPLPTSVYTIDAVQTIVAGHLQDTMEIHFLNTTSLDPNLIYGIGLTIVSADGGFQVASNLRHVLLKVNVKNIYDGDYTSNGYFYHPSVPRDIIDRPKTLSTVTATSVACELGDLGASNYIAIFDVDGSNNLTITPYPGSAGGAYSIWTAGLPTNNPGYTPAWPRSSECNNIYDPATKSFKVRYGYTGGTGYRVTEEVITRNP